MYKLYILSIFLYLLTTVNAKFCKLDADCDADTVCKEGLCTCGVGKISSSDGSTCLNIALTIGSDCIEDIQCISTYPSPTLCTKDLLCGCKPGYKYINNGCTEINGYKGKCELNSDCYDGINFNALECVNGECTCAKGYYARNDMECRLSANDTKKCFFDMDCGSDVECCEFKYGPLGDCVSNLNPNNTCSGLEQPKPEEPEEPEETFYQIYKNSRLISHTNKIDNNICSTDNDCSTIKNSFCPEFKKTCSCNDGFVYNPYTNNCVQPLGSSCVDDEDCPILYSYCNENNICTCQNYFVNSNYNEKCFKPARGLNMSCGRDENCYSLGVHGICSKSKCSCKINSEYDEESLYCHAATDPEDNECEDNCEKKPHSSCVENRCLCDENYLSEKNKCLPDIGFTCSMQLKDCVVENAECKNDKCECIEGYLKSDNRICVQEITEEDNCVTHVQCEQIYGTGGICLEQNCTCLPEYQIMIVNKQNKCVLERTLGEQCTSNIDCKTLPHNSFVVCRNGKCECDYGHYLEENELGEKYCNNGSSVLLLSNLLIWTIATMLIAYK